MGGYLWQIARGLREDNGRLAGKDRGRIDTENGGGISGRVFEIVEDGLWKIVGDSGKAWQIFCGRLWEINGSNLEKPLSPSNGDSGEF